MLNVTAFLLIVMWLVGLGSGYKLGGGIHVLLLAGVVIFIYKTTRRPRHDRVEHIEYNNKLSLTRAHAEVTDDAINGLRR